MTVWNGHDGNPPDDAKHCPKCDEWKWLVEFGLREASKDGRQAWCKACARELAREIRRRKKRRPTTDQAEAYKRRKKIRRRAVADLIAAHPDDYKVQLVWWRERARLENW